VVVAVVVVVVPANDCIRKPICGGEGGRRHVIARPGLKIGRW